MSVTTSGRDGFGACSGYLTGELRSTAGTRHHEESVQCEVAQGGARSEFPRAESAQAVAFAWSGCSAFATFRDCTIALIRFFAAALPQCGAGEGARQAANRRVHFQPRRPITVEGRSQPCQPEFRLMDTAISSNPPSAIQPAAAPVADKVTKQGTAGAAAAPATPTPSATVTLSPAAQAAQEASETPEQTAREARGNDRQAQRLVAKQAAVAKMYAGA